MSLPPVSADCQTTIQPPQPGAPPQQTPWRMLRSADGKVRLDFPTSSVIQDPAAGKAIVLDHVKKMAVVAPLPQQSGMPPLPGMPAMPGMPAAPQPPPGTTVQDLGQRLLNGRQVLGQYMVQPPTMPSAPAAPGMPPIPHPPTVIEMWTDAQTHVPMLTKFTGSFGQQISSCHPPVVGELHPSVFQIPPDYKVG